MSITEQFFVAGGALGPEAPSYVARSVDDALLNLVRQGKFGLVVGRHQTGKSSLLVRTCSRLRSEGVACGFVDLGSFRRGQSAEEVYDGILATLAQQIGAASEVAALRGESTAQTAEQRFTTALGRVLIPRAGERLVILLDDLDALQRLALPAPHILATLRDLHDRRQAEPAFARLSLAMATEADPETYGAEEHRAPFAAADVLRTSDFTVPEAQPLARGLAAAGRPAPLLGRSLYWTAGQPYLTQRLCRAVAEDPAAKSDGDVDRICRELFLTPEARDRDENLRSVRDGLLRGNAERPGTLALYAEILAGKTVAAGSADPRVVALQRSGVLAHTAGQLAVRNPIYANAFDRDWVAANLPAARASRRPMTVAAVVIAASLLVAGVVGVAGKRAGWFGRPTTTVVQGPSPAQTRPAPPAPDTTRPGADATRPGADATRPGADATPRVPGVSTPEAFSKEIDARLERERKAAQEAERQRQARKTAKPSLPAPTAQERTADQRRRQTAQQAEARMQKMLRRARHEAEEARRRARQTVQQPLPETDIRVPTLPRVPAQPAPSIQVSSGARQQAGRAQQQAERARRRALQAQQRADAERQRREAEEQARRQREEQARIAREQAEKARQQAAAERERARFTAARLSVATGQRLEDSDDILASLLWYAEARRIEQDKPARDRVHALRFAGTLRRAPRLAQAWMTPSAGTPLGFAPGGVVFVAPNGKVTRWSGDTDRATTLSLPLEPGTRVIGLSPSGERLLTQGRDNAVRLWDIAAGTAVGKPWDAAERLVRTAISSDGKRVAAADAARTVRAWEPATGDVRILGRLSEQPTSLSISADGRRIAAAWPASATDENAPGEAAVWTIAGAGADETRLRQDRAIRAVRLSPDGRHLLLAGRAGSAMYQLAAAPTPGDGSVLTAPARRVWTKEAPADEAVFDAEGARVAVANGETVNLYQTASGEETVGAIRAGTTVRDLRFSPDGGRIAIAGAAGTARVWSARTGEALTPPLRHPQSVERAVFGPDGRYLLTADATGGSRVWDLLPQDAGAGRVLTQDRTDRIAFRPDGAMVVTAGADNAAHRFETRTAREVLPALRHDGPVNDVAFDPTGNRVLTGSTDGSARVWDAQTGSAIGTMLQHGAPVTRARFSPDGRRIVTGAEDGSVLLWDAASGQRVGEPMAHPFRIVAAEFSPSGSHLAIGASAGEAGRGGAYIWDLAAARRLDLEDADSGIIRFSPDGKAVITARGPLARIRDIATGLALTPALTHGAGILDAAFSPDGARVATAGEDGSARVWDARTGQILAPSMRQNGPIRSVRFNGDGSLLLTAGADGNARLWDAATGEAVLSLPHDGPLAVAQFGPHDRQVAGASDGVRLWDLPESRHNATEAMRLAEVLTSARVNPNGPGMVAIEPVQLAKAWDTLRAARSGDFVASNDEVRAGFDRAALAHEQAGRWPEAVQALTSLIALAPNEPDLLERRSRAYAQMGNWESAAADATRGAQINPDRMVFWQLLGDAYMAGERFAQAADAYSQGIQRDASSAVLWNLRGVAQYQLQRFDAARADFSEAIARDDRDAQLYLNRAAAYRALGQIESDLADVTRAAELQPEDPAIWSQRAEIYADQGVWDKAVADYERSASLDKTALTYSTLAVARLAAGDPQGYQETCRQMAAQFGNTQDAIVDIVSDSVTARTCVLLPDSDTDVQRMLQLSAQAVAKAPGNAEVQRTHGFVLYRAGQHAQAVTYLTAALQRQNPQDKSNPWIGGYEYLTLAMAYQRLGQNEAAQKALEQGQKLVEDALKGRIAQDGRMLLWHQRVELMRVRDEALTLVGRTQPVARAIRRRIETLAAALPRLPMAPNLAYA